MYGVVTRRFIWALGTMSILIGLGAGGLRAWNNYKTESAVRTVVAIGGNIEKSPQLLYNVELRKRSLSFSSLGPIRWELGWPPKRRPRDIYFVDLSACAVTESEAQAIAGLSECEIMSLRNARLSETAILELLSIQRLNVVDIRGLAINDQLRRAVGDLPKLYALIVTLDGNALAITQLKEQLPDCRIVVTKPVRTEPTTGTGSESEEEEFKE